jgi:hypothetical protein
MQTMDLSGTAPQSENRLKSLFWPSIHNATDVEYLGSQGFWICTIIGVGSFALSLFAGQYISGFFVLLYFYLGGNGVRQRDVFAAVAVFMLMLTTVLISPGILTFFGCVILLSNMRATFIASFWEPGAENAEPAIRFNETFGDKLVDQFPAWLWPKIRYGYYAFAVIFLLLTLVGLFVLAMRPHLPR